MDFHHIGYLVKNIYDSIDAFVTLGYEIEQGVRNDNIRQVFIAFMRKGISRIEVIQPISKESPIYGLMKHYRNNPYHLCFTTDDLDGQVKSLQKKGFILFKEREKALCLNGEDIVFLMHPDLGMIELCEMANKNSGGIFC